MKSLLTVFGLSIGVTSATPRVEPVRHDYGQAVVDAVVSQTFRVSLADGVTYDPARDRRTLRLIGPDAGDSTRRSPTAITARIGRPTAATSMSPSSRDRSGSRPQRSW